MSIARRPVLLLLFKFLVTAGCLWWLSRYVDLDAIRLSLTGFSVRVVLAGVALFVLSNLAGGIRWWYLFRHLAGPVSLRQVLPSYYLGVFFNNVLPSAYGGDLARSARLYVSGMSGSALVGSALIDRLLGLAAVVTMGGLALMFADIGPAGRLAWTAFAVCALVVLVAAAVMALPDWTRALDSRAGRRWPRLHAVLSCFPEFRGAPGLIRKAFLLSVLNQALVVVALILLAREAGIGVSAVQFVAILMLAFLVASLPVSLGGLGPREGALMALLLPLGVDASAVLALSVAYLIVLWSSALPGLFMLFTRVARPEASREPTAP